MLPLSLLKTAQGHPMLVELKNGETCNGHLVNCDTWMNIHLREVIPYIKGAEASNDAFLLKCIHMMIKKRDWFRTDQSLLA